MARTPTPANRVTLRGTLSRDPEVRSFDSGSTLTTFLVKAPDHEGRPTTIPVSAWDDAAGGLEGAAAGAFVEVAGVVRTRFWAGPDGKRSRVEVVASATRLR